MASKDSLLLLLSDKWNRNITIKTFREKSDMRSTYVRIFLPHGSLDFQNVRFQLACTYYLFLKNAEVFFGCLAWAVLPRCDDLDGVTNPHGRTLFGPERSEANAGDYPQVLIRLSA